MAGAMVSVVRKSDFVLGISTAASPNNKTDILLAPLVDTTGWVSAVYLWRVFATYGNGAVATPYPTGSTLALVIQNAMVGPDDPNTVLVAATDLVNITVATQTTNTLVSNVVAGPIGRYVRVLLRATGVSTAGIINISCAVDLVGRDA